MTVRRADSGDAASIVELEASCFGGDAWSVDAVIAELTGENRRVAVAEDDDGLLGYVALSLAADVADLTRVAVAPTARRRGLGTALLGWAVQEAATAGAERVVLEVAATNEPAVRLYAAAGFTEVARRSRYYRAGVDAVVMARQVR